MEDICVNVASTAKEFGVEEIMPMMSTLPDLNALTMR